MRTFFENSPPEFNLRVREPHLNCTWYVINGSAPQYFIGGTGTIDQTIWEDQADGPVVIEFTALDRVGNMGIIAAIVQKRTNDPEPAPIEPDNPELPYNPFDSYTTVQVLLSLGMVGVIVIGLIVKKKLK